MKKKLISIFLSAILLLSLLGCGGCSSALFSAPANADTAFEKFTLSLFQTEAAGSTLNLHYTLKDPSAYGILDTPITYGSFPTDEKSVMASTENCLASLESISYEDLSRENQLTYDVLRAYLDLSLKNGKYLLYDEPLSPLTGIQAQLPILLAEYQFDSPSDVETYLSLLTVTPEYFDSLAAYEKTKSEAGLFLSDETVDDVVEQCNSFISMGESNYLLSTFEERLSALGDDLSKEQRAAYLEQNRTAIEENVLPAYASLIDVLNSLKGTGKTSGGVCSLPDGKDYYSYVVARETGSNRSITELKKLIQAQMHEDFQAVKLSAEKLNAAKETSNTAMTASPDLLLRRLEEKTSLLFPACPGVDASIKYVPTAMEPYLSPAFYLIPAIDNTGGNVIYINKAHSMDVMTLYTTLAHEGYPGHLYQTNYFAAKNNSPLRSILNFGGYVEGWATYAEMCSYYLTAIPKEEAALLQKNSSFLLGLYSTADIGIHYDGWSLEDTVKFFSMYGIEDAAAVREIYQLIVSDPANYLKYYIGYVELLDLKKEYMALKGDSFSQKEFHKAVLDVGPSPFSVLKKYVLGKDI